MSDAMSSSDLARAGGPERWWTLGAMCLTLILILVNTSIVSVAVPTIQRASTTGVQWIVDAYLLLYASLLIAAGVVGDQYGPRRIFLGGLVVFAAGSLLSGLAPSTIVLIVGRGVQGIGAAALLPMTLSIIARAFPNPGERAEAIGIWGAGSGVGLAIGPTLGGLLVEGPGWRWVFLIALPIQLTVLAVTLLVVPPDRRSSTPRHFDFTGATLTVAALGLLTYGLIEAGTKGFGSETVIALLAAGCVGLLVFVVVELRLRRPLLDPRLFLKRSFAIANADGLLVFFAFLAPLVYFSIFFQRIQHASAVGSGLRLLPLSAGVAVMAPLAGRVARRRGASIPLVAGLAIAGVGLLCFLGLTPTSTYSSLWWEFALVGIGLGLTMTPMTAAALEAVEPEQAGMAGGALNACRQIGNTVGVALFGSIVASGVRQAPAGSPQSGFVAGFHVDLAIAGIALIAAAIASLLALRNRRG
jgi:MFS transporter, DHA2 family, methylenomycin A resistance protein